MVEHMIRETRKPPRPKNGIRVFHMAEKILNVLYQSDNGYSMVTGVSIVSLCENNQHLDEINIFLIDDDIAPINLRRIRDIVKRYGRTLHIVDAEPIRNKLIEMKVTPWRGTYTTYYKLLAARDLPIKTDRVLQLDGDTIINRPLDELLEMDLGDSVCAATIDCVLTEYKELLGIPREEFYYNCGIMLISQPNWIAKRCTERIIEHLTTVRSKYFVVDQDIMNILFRHDIRFMSATYNFNTCFYIYGVDYTFKIYHLTDEIYMPHDELQRILDEGPVINHCMSAFTGRPWEHNSIHPQNALFDRYLAMTEWTDADKLDVRRSFVFRAQRFAYLHLPLSLYWYVHRGVLTVWMWNQDRVCRAEEAKAAKAAQAEERREARIAAAKEKIEAEAKALAKAAEVNAELESEIGSR